MIYPLVFLDYGLLQNAISCGLDTHNYVSRSIYMGGIWPGEFRWNNQSCFIAIAGNETDFPAADKNCQLLVWHKGVFDFYNKWAPYHSNHSLPEGAFLAGNDSDGTPLYIFNGFITGDYHCGYIKNGQAAIPYGGKEMLLSSGYILVAKG